MSDLELKDCKCREKWTNLQEEIIFPYPLSSAYYQVSCHKCGRRGPWSKDRNQAMELWNDDSKTV